MRNIAIIPARSGSKGLKDKNIRELSGIPLLAYSIIAAQKSGVFSEIMVSTDSMVYAELAKKYGAAVPFLRSAELSGDSVGSWDVVKKVLAQYEAMGEKFDSVCLLQPTSPLRSEEDILKGYHIYKEKTADAVTAVCEVEHSPLWMMTLPSDGSLCDFRRKIGASLPRQLLEQYYQINGALYIKKIKYVDSVVELLDEKEYAYVMDKRRSVDIDTIEDFQYAEYLNSLIEE